MESPGYWRSISASASRRVAPSGKVRGCWLQPACWRSVANNRTRTSISRILPAPVAGFAARLFQQANVLDDHRLVQRLGHVIDRQGRHADGGERFHLDARL